MRRFYFLSLVAALAGSRVARAHEHLSTLAEILDAAEKHSPSLAAEGARAQATAAAIGAARAGYWPSLEVDAIDSTGFPGSTGALGIGGVAGSPYRSGPAAGVLLKQSLWDFGRTASEVRATRHENLAQEQQRRIEAARTDEDAAQIYFECIRYQTNRETGDFVLERAQAIANEVNHFVSTGQRSIVERYLARSQVEEARTARDDAQEHQALIRERLALVTGIPAQELHCPKADAVEGTFDLPPRESDVENANPLILRAKEDEEAARARVDAAQANFFPKLVGLASAGWMSGARLVPEKNYALGLGLSFPLFEGFRTQHEQERAEALEREKTLRVEATRDYIAKVNLVFDESIRARREKLNHLTQELEIIEKGYALAQQRYTALQGTLIDVRESLRGLNRTRSAIDQERVSLLESLAAKYLFNGRRPLPPR